MKILKKKKKGNQQIVPDERYRELDSHAPNENEIADEAPMSRKILYYLKLVYHEIRENITIYLLIILYLCVCVMNKIMAKRTLKKIGNYSFVTSETHNTICMVVFFSLYFIFGRRVTSAKERHQNFGLQFLLISLLDACSVIIAFIVLRHAAQHSDKYVFLLSDFTIQIPPVQLRWCIHHCTDHRYCGVYTVFRNAGREFHRPMSFSNMTREIVFKKYKINILRLNAVVSFFQIFTSCLMLPMYTLPFLKQINLPFSEIGTNIKNGFRCLILGQNTIVENCGLGMAKMCDDCEGAWKTFLAYSFFNICDNLITSFIIDKFSTMTYTIVSCIQGPAIAIAYYFKFLAGDAVMKPRVLDFVTLFGYLFGSIIYRVGNIILEKKKMMEAGNDDDSEGELTNAESIITQ
eukprot:XP_002257567.1 chloroquine resistance transporter, putative [Plasmodium knowlesi strain H]